MRRLCQIALFLALLARTTAAAPTPKEFLGYEIGSRFTSHERVVAYFDELAKQSPNLSISRYGETWEGRPLIYAVLASPENAARLDQLRAASAAITEADRTSRTRAEEIANTSPVVVWLAFGVHGDESSSSEAAMLLASKLLSGDEESRRILESVVVIIDPVQNPDGRDRYIHWYRNTRGRGPDVNPDSAEHHEPWPGGRYNHYLIDLNRDWSSATQPETRARLDAYRQWWPQVVVDLHEMSYGSSYFFPPAADPRNANIGADIERWFEVFGRANADAFSQRTWPFFVSERYDFFYPGYADTWTSLRGAVGMTYEMAGGEMAGTAVRREDGTILTLSDRIERHYTAAMVTLATAAANRRELIIRTWEASRRSIDNGRDVYLFPPQGGNLVAALQSLRRQGVDVRVLSSGVRIRARVPGGPDTQREFPAGTAVISTRQPAGALVQSLMERSPQIQPEYIEEQRELIDADEEDDFYDVTSWALPLAHNLEVFVASAPLESALSEWKEPADGSAFPAGQLAYLVDASDPNVYRAAGAMLRADVEFSVSDAAFSRAGRTFARGTLLVQRGNNGAATLDDRLRRVAAETDAVFVPLASGWEGNLSLGSRRLRHVRDPRIALVGGEGTSPTSFGTLWYTFEEDQRIPHSVIPLSRLRNTDLRFYRVLVLPEGEGYESALGAAGIERLKSWVKGGGTLIAIGEASAFLRKKEIAMSELQEWPGKDENGEEDRAPRYNDFSVPGAAFRTTLNGRSFLTLGVPRPPDVLVRGSAVLLPAEHKIDNVVNVAQESPLSSGFAWPESIERMRGAVYLASEPYGSGQVITFADQPVFRLYWRGSLPLLMNAVLYAPSFPRD